MCRTKAASGRLHRRVTSRRSPSGPLRGGLPARLFFTALAEAAGDTMVTGSPMPMTPHEAGERGGAENEMGG